MNLLQNISNSEIYHSDLLKETALLLFLEVDENSNNTLRNNLLYILKIIKSNQKLGSVEFDFLLNSILSRLIDLDHEKNPGKFLFHFRKHFELMAALISNLSLDNSIR